MMLALEQISAAIAMTGMTQDELAHLAGIARPTLNRILNKETQAKDETLRRIREALEAKGIEFIGSIGLQWAQHQVRSLVGVEGLKTFFDDVRAVAKESDEEICIYGFEEDYFEEKLGEYLDYHRTVMAEYGNVNMRCLIQESDFNVGASDYCKYRWMPKETFSNVPFYTYGDKTAIIATSAPEAPLVLLIHNRSIARAYRKQFSAMWAQAKEPILKEEK